MTCLKFMGLTQPVAGYPQMVQKDEFKGLTYVDIVFFEACHWLKFKGLTLMLSQNFEQHIVAAGG